jgi:hypothetical protein
MGKDKDKDKDKTVGKVGASDSTKAVKSTEAVSDVDKVKATSAVGRVTGVSGVGATNAIGRISLEQRDKLMSIVSEEAAKLAAQGVIPASQREIVEQAVKMVIDASLEETSGDKKR